MRDGCSPVSAALAIAGGTPFSTAGVPVARDVLVLEAGVDVTIAPMASLGLPYCGQIGSGASDHSLKASLGVRL